MKWPNNPARGQRALKAFLRDQCSDLRQLDLTRFRAWIEQQLGIWSKDPAFLQRTEIRDLYRSHPQLRLLEREYRSALRADSASPAFQQLTRTDRAMTNTGKAIAGLTLASTQANGARHGQLELKLRHAQRQLAELTEHHASLVHTSPEREALVLAQSRWEQCRMELGLDRLETRLAELLQSQGRRSGQSGKRFEQLALELTHERIAPRFASTRRSSTSTKGSTTSSSEILILTGVTLGAARLEFDQLIVRRSKRTDSVARVLAIVEAKRNPNDLARGFKLRQENIAWLRGELEQERAQLYRNRNFPSGRFDRSVSCHADGGTLVLNAESFNLFRRDPGSGHYLGRLYFITRPGTLWGLSSAALGRIQHRIATDRNWQPDSDDYMRGLLEWCRSLSTDFETPDVLAEYGAKPTWARQILLAGQS